VTHLRHGGGMPWHGRIFNDFSTEFSYARILEIGQYLLELWQNICGLVFGPPCTTRKQRFKVFSWIRQNYTT